MHKLTQVTVSSSAIKDSLKEIKQSFSLDNATKGSLDKEEHEKISATCTVVTGETVWGGSGEKGGKRT